MSYDIYMLDNNGAVIQYVRPYDIRGGTYYIEGTREAHYNITYNYAQIFYRVLGEKGIRTIYNMTGRDSCQILTDAIQKLKSDFTADYWEATEGNAKLALIDLLRMALISPEGKWSGD